jgi:hypothetical protein
MINLNVIGICYQNDIIMLYILGNQVKGKVIGTTLGYIQYCSFSPDDKLVAACCENDVIILDIKVCTVL